MFAFSFGFFVLSCEATQASKLHHKSMSQKKGPICPTRIGMTNLDHDSMKGRLVLMAS